MYKGTAVFVRPIKGKAMASFGMCRIIHTSATPY